MPQDFATDYRQQGLRYFKYSYWLKKKFGGEVYRACIDAGFSCPNLDGTISAAGCLFCDQKSFTPTEDTRDLCVEQQVIKRIIQCDRRHPGAHYLAYFQAASNTYAAPSVLADLYARALAHPRIKGLVVATRPDCVNDEILEVLTSFSKNYFVGVEYGMQSSHDASLQWMKRGHSAACLAQAVTKTLRCGLAVGVHVILGIPGESVDDVIATAHAINQLGVHEVKIHNLYIAKQSTLASLYRKGGVRVLTRDEYMSLLITFLEHLDPHIVVQRIIADIPERYVLAPDWIQDKSTFLRLFEQALEHGDSFQGKRLSLKK